MGLFMKHVLGFGLSMCAANVKYSAGRYALHIGSFFSFLVAITSIFMISKFKYHLSIIAILHISHTLPCAPQLATCSPYVRLLP